MVNPESIFKEVLHEQERIIWSGQPTLKLLNRADIFLVPFSLMWGGFALFWEYTALSQNAPLDVKLFGIPFVIIGLYFIFGRFIYKRYKKKHTFYAVTGSRALISYQSAAKHMESVELRTVANISKSTNRDGSGTLQFGKTNIYSAMYANTGLEFFMNMYGDLTPAFYDIPDVDKVYDLVVKAQRAD